MKNAFERYQEAMEIAFGDGDKKERIRAFVKAMMARAEKSTREQVDANETPLLHALRGQNTILFELADWAVMALDTNKAKANAGSDIGIPFADD